jgi:hypothetical protein
MMKTLVTGKTSRGIISALYILSDGTAGAMLTKRVHVQQLYKYL